MRLRKNGVYTNKSTLNKPGRLATLNLFRLFSSKQKYWLDGWTR